MDAMKGVARRQRAQEVDNGTVENGRLTCDSRGIREQLLRSPIAGMRAKHVGEAVGSRASSQIRRRLLPRRAQEGLTPKRATQPRKATGKPPDVPVAKTRQPRSGAPKQVVGQSPTRSRQDKPPDKGTP